LLDVKGCLDCLATMRHTKWFQAKVSIRPSCLAVIRVLMDFCQHVPTWSMLSQWALELLVEKACSSHEGTKELTPAEALMKVFQLVASGILLEGGPGLYDPCEKNPTDATAGIPIQEKEDITNSAQHALRMIAFGQMRRVITLKILPEAPAAVDEADAAPAAKRLKTDSPTPMLID